MRPSKFTDAIAETICLRIVEGESLRTVCLDEAMPDKATVFRWLATNDAFRAQYAAAREAQADAMAEEILDIADDGTNDYMEKQLGGDCPTVSVVDHEHISRSKLRVDARKWLIAKLAPKKYGDRVRIGADETAPPLMPSGPTPQQVTDGLREIFDDLLPGAPAKEPKGGHRVVRKAAAGRGGKKRRAPKAGKAVARKE